MGPSRDNDRKDDTMKKIAALLLTLVLLLTVCACGSGETNTTPGGQEQEEQPAVAYEVTDSRARTWTSGTGTTWVQTIVEITNTGTSNLYLSSGSYDLEDAGGNLVASQTLVSAHPEVLAPGEKGYMYEETTLDEPVEGELTVLPRESVEEAKVDLIRFPVTEAKLTEGSYGGFKMTGRVENTGEEEEGMVFVTAFLYDAEGVFLGELFTILMEDLAPGDKIGFEMSSYSLPDDVTLESVADFTVYAYPTQYQF